MEGLGLNQNPLLGGFKQTHYVEGLSQTLTCSVLASPLPGQNNYPKSLRHASFTARDLASPLPQSLGGFRQTLEMDNLSRPYYGGF